MLSKGLLGTLAIAAGLTLAGSASAGDDTMSLKLTKSPAVTGGVGASGQFVHDDRATTDDGDDTEEVNLRYRLGYNRGYYGGGYIFPRTFAWRSGYYTGYYGGFGGYGYGGYGYGGYGYYRPRYYYGGGYYPAYYASSVYYAGPIYSAPPVIYSSPPVCCDPIAGSVGTYGPTATLRGSSMIPRRPMQDPEPPSADARPMKTRTLPPTYRYDGNPSGTVPATPNRILPPRSDEPAPKIDPADGRLVKVPAAKKHTYPAYGDNRRSQPDADTLLVKQKKD